MLFTHGCSADDPLTPHLQTNSLVLHSLVVVITEGRVRDVGPENDVRQMRFLQKGLET